MKVKVCVAGSGTENDPYRPDVVPITYAVIQYNLTEGWVIIEIDPGDYEKIKDKVIEVVEQ
ncbi:MAG: hypothetical protein J7J51_05265 [Candidatus Omnitrophica bacterium]|nr:hypothetical protein [Candidatus Omnitrophota bacterium]